MAEPLIVFAGEVRCQAAPGVPGLTLSGRTAAHPQARTELAFSARAPTALPSTLSDVRIEAQPDGGWRITSAAGSWQVAGGAVHLHREIAREFYTALPPRPVPRLKRLFWYAVLTLARSRAGIALLRGLRG
jgi:hypothetical protein